MVLLPLLVMQLGCNKKKNNNGSVAANPGYYMNNGICMASNGQQVSSNFCYNNNGGFGTNGNNGYYINNGQCYSVQNQVVAMTYCQNTGLPNGGFGGTGGFGSTTQCNGFYYEYTMWGYQSVYCTGYSCSGYMLLNNMGQQVYCM